MFILSGGLVRTGVLAGISAQITKHASTRPRTVIALLALAVLFASAFMNNTPVVVVLIPIVVQLAQAIGVSASRLLIPLSYLAIMGGLCTLIGTSTNLLGGRGGARGRASRTVHALRDHAAQPDRGGGRADLPALRGAGAAARPRLDGRHAGRSEEHEVLHRGRGARGLLAEGRAGVRRLEPLQARGDARDRRAEGRRVAAPPVPRGGAGRGRPGGAAHRRARACWG